MIEVTEADRLAAAQLIENYWHGDPSKAGNGMRRLAQSYKDGHAQGVWVTAFATHRIEAAKAERGRLQPKMEALEAALRRMIYETTHLSPMKPNGDHDCTIKADALEQARQALESQP